MLGCLPAGTGLVPCAWAYPTTRLKTNAPRAQNRIQSEIFIFSSLINTHAWSPRPTCFYSVSSINGEHSKLIFCACGAVSRTWEDLRIVMRAQCLINAVTGQWDFA